MSAKSKLHARRRAARFGDLDQLLAEALREQKRGEGAIKRLKGINAIIHEQFANPINWTDRGVLMLIYVDERTGERTTVGKFQDQVHRTGARRLTRVADDTCLPVPAPVPVITDRDPFLIRGKPVYTYTPAPIKDPLAQQAIRAYLQRTKEQPLGEFLGSKIDASKLLNDLHKMKLVTEV